MQVPQQSLRYLPALIQVRIRLYGVEGVEVEVDEPIKIDAETRKDPTRVDPKVVVEVQLRL